MSRGKLILLCLLAFGMSILAAVRFFDARMKEPLFFLAKTRITQIATEAVNTAIAARFAEQAAAGGLIRWQTNARGDISGFVIDYREQMRITAETVRVVQDVLREKERLPERIPLGHALDSPLLSAVGPQVAVRFHPIGAVRAQVETRQHNAGINHVLVEVFLRVRTDIAIVIPFDRHAETIETEIPLTYVLVAGDVPLYYYDNKGNPVGGSAQAPPVVLPPVTEPESAPGVE
ncbi:MAG: sporulation protein YunB [Paenibacillaceae bacterium ZCTH02-B3]|nr:MAG: sporulation protein YunB [Paenibacillaceae bacterium ZCTH02-B3]